jgi:rubrerythrin
VVDSDFFASTTQVVEVGDGGWKPARSNTTSSEVQNSQKVIRVWESGVERGNHEMERENMEEMVMKNIMNISTTMIATCGINCGFCIAHLREKNPCPGCNLEGPGKPKHCSTCSRKICDQKPAVSSFCFECKKYPCIRMRRLDGIYRSKYGVSPVDNLDQINKIGLKKFTKIENARWTCRECGGPIGINDKKCYSCGKQYPFPKTEMRKIRSN